MSYRSDREEFLVRLAIELPGVPPTAILDYGRAILRAARQLDRLAVALCNGAVDQDRYESAKARAVARVRRALDGLAEWTDRRVTIAEAGGDPRGYTLKLRLPSGKGNTWGGDECGWGVPS